MKITIKIIYTSSDDGTNLLQNASFPVNEYKFKNAPDQEAARVAFVWWELIKRNMSYRVEIREVFYNETNDITGLVKQLDDAPIHDLDLPF